MKRRPCHLDSLGDAPQTRVVSVAGRARPPLVQLDGVPAVLVRLPDDVVLVALPARPRRRDGDVELVLVCAAPEARARPLMARVGGPVVRETRAGARIGAGGAPDGAKGSREEMAERLLEDGQVGVDDAEVGFQERPDAALNEVVRLVLSVLEGILQRCRAQDGADGDAGRGCYVRC